MKKPLLFAFLLLAVYIDAFSQLHYIAGTVTDESGKPLYGVEVFLRGTSRLTLTNTDGAFNISRLSVGNYELVAKLVGRETYHAAFILTQSSKFNISMPLSVRALRKPAIHQNKHPASRKAEYSLFENTFLGQTANSARCRILNPGVINLYTDPETDILHADSGGDFIEIQNKALGYHIKYILDKFTIESNEGHSYYLSRVYFQEMAGSLKQKQKWNNARRMAYAGSPQHMLKVLYESRVEEEGFEIRNLTRIPNKESISKSNYTTKRRKLDSLLAARMISKAGYNDSISILGKAAHMPEYKQILSKQTISSDSLLGKKEGPNRELQIADMLYVRYKNERPDWDYNLPWQIKMLKKPFEEGQVSLVSVRESKPIIDASGNLTNPLSLLYTGYFTWERVGDMLPKDYIYKH